jgi:hypothetical protein
MVQFHSRFSHRIPWVKLTDFKQRLREILGSHNSSNLDLSKFEPHVAIAVDRAQQLHPDDQHYWPQTIGTHVHRLVQAIMEAL